MFKSILRFVKSAHFLSMLFACVFGVFFITNSFAGICNTNSMYYNDQSNPNYTNCSECPSSSVWSTQHISNCGGSNHVFTCASGYTLKNKYGGGLECGCGSDQFAYFSSNGQYDFVCVDCSFARSKGSSTQNYIEHCGWTDYTKGYRESFSCRDGFTQEDAVYSYYGEFPYYKCTCAGSGEYVFGTQNTTSATCLWCSDTNTTGATCGSGNFTCGQGYIRSKDGSKYRCADCRLSGSGSTVVSPYYGNNMSNVQLQYITSGSNVTKTIGSDSCTVTLTWTNSSSCNVTQVYTKTGVTRDASYSSNYNSNAYPLTKNTITATAANYYGYGGDNETSSIQCRECADGYWTAAASGKNNIPLSCNSAPLHGSVSGGVVTCDKNYYKVGNSGTTCYICPQYKNYAGTEQLTAEYLWNNSGNPNLSVLRGDTSASGATSITQCYRTVSGSDGTGSYSYPNPCYYSGSSAPYWYVYLNSPSNACKSALAQYCEEYVKGNVMTEYEFEDAFGDEVDQFENCATSFYSGYPVQLYNADDIVTMSRMTNSKCSPADFGTYYY